MRMKKIIILLLLLTLQTRAVTFAQKMKIVEQSAKNAPSWINDLERGYITAGSSEATLELAKRSAVTSVKQQIASAIVSNVSVEFRQSSVMNETEKNATLQAETVDFVRSSTDKIPFLQSISLTKVADFYWEKHNSKKTGETIFYYYVKYPFSDAELDALVREFNEKQLKINNTIIEMMEELDTFTEIEDISKNMGTLRALVPELADGDPRIKVIDETTNRYREQYKYISINIVEHKDKRVVMQPYLNGRKVSTSQLPTYKSTGADRIEISLLRGEIVITYDDYVCRAGDDNWINFVFKFGTYFVESKVYILK